MRRIPRPNAFSALAIVASAALLLMHAAPAAAQPRTPTRAELEPVVHDALSTVLGIGAVVVLVRGDSIVFREAFGRSSMEPGAPPLSPDALFHIGPAAPLLAAMAALRLADDGRLDLDAPIGRYVPELVPELGGATVAQLLTHTGGLAARLAVPGREGADDLGSAARRLTRLDRVAPPGVIYSSSRHGVALAGLALERAAGRGYAEMMRELVFEPFGMSRATFDGDAVRAALTPGHIASRSAAAPNERVQAAPDSAWALPVRGFFATATDLARLAIALSADGEAGLVAELWSPRVQTQGPNAQAIGFASAGLWEGRRSIRITGGAGGHGILMHVIPEERVAAILIMNKSAYSGNVTSFALRRMLGLPDPPPSTPVSAPAPGTPDPAALRRLAEHAGTWVNGGEVLDIVVAGGQPILRSGDMTLEIRSIDGATFGAFIDERAVLRFTLVEDVPGGPYLHLGDRVLSLETRAGGG
jgi:D-alanyl-D-alanine carboxypeptidase